MSLTSWFLVSSGGTRHRLPREMIFVGRDDCELMLQSRSVDKQHAVINYEAASDEHKVKDLGSLNGTFVNDVRIQEQMYITLKTDDKLRFGYDTNLFTVVRGELHVPEEALKHEKFTSQLQLTKKSSDGETSKSPSTKATESRAAEGSCEGPAKPNEMLRGDEKMAGDLAALHRGTPLYGQPSWWGDGDADDENSFKQETKGSSKRQESSVSDGKEPNRSKEDSLCPPGQEPTYFEIPTKESLMAESSIHEIPTKDTEGAAAATAATTAAEATAQGHASFTIEFDDTTPGKVTIRDHVTKYTPDHRPRSKKSPQQDKELSTLQAAMMASESKVADWLAQNDPPLARMESTEEDSKSIKSDVPVHLNRLKGSKHADGTQSDSENGAGNRFNGRRLALEQRLQAAQGGQGAGEKGAEGAASATSRTSFMIEFFDEDSSRKHRSYSFSQAAPPVGLAGEGPCPMPPSQTKGSVPPTDLRVSVSPLAAGRQSLKQKSDGSSPAWSSASVGQQTSPSDDLHKPPCPNKELEDDQSDKGTYTIELESHNPEEVEARRMIDKVFGVEESQVTNRSACMEHQQDGVKERQKPGKAEMRKTYYIDSETLSEDLFVVGSPRWVSQWASLAANHTRTDPEGSGAESPAFVHHEKVAEVGESGVSIKSIISSSSSHAERKRRTLPQLPTEEKGPDVLRKAPGKGPLGPGLRSEIGEKQDTEPQEKESQSDLDPVARVTKTGHKAVVGSPAEGSTTSKQAPAKEPARDQRGGMQPGASSKPSARQTSGEKRQEEGWGTQGKGADAAEKSSKPLVRQGSFTIEKPSANVPIELIPRINKQAGTSALAHGRRDSAGSIDTATLLKDTEAVMAFLEAKLRDEGRQEPADPPSYPMEDSISPESDIDTASTVSQAAGEGDRKAPLKRRTLSSLHKEKSAGSSAAKNAASARERLERKSKTRPSDGRPEPRRSAQSGSRARQPSLDLTDDDLTSSLPHSTFSDVLSSDQETYSGRSHGRGQLTSTDELLHSKLESGKAGRSKVPQTCSPVPGKPATLPRPRPTRASLLRRARLGDTSDTDLADADKVSVASEVSTTSSTSKPLSGRKAPSRIDMLAQPRRTRLGSLSARSDSEATVSRSSGTSRASTETTLRLGLRSGSTMDSKAVPRMRANSVSKLPDAKVKTSSIHSSPSDNATPVPESAPAVEEPLATNRWRRLPPEYASTSEDEFGSNRHPSKHARLRPGTAPRGVRLGSSAPSTPGTGGVVLKHRMREQEEYIRDWTAHSEEIARLFPCVRRISQDLAKDLAMLAREIHDVAGEIDSVSSSGTAPSTTVSTAATTPGSAIDTREELVDRVFDESLNFRKTPPTVQSKAPEINGRPVELRPRPVDGQDPQVAIRRRTWNRDEAVLDSLLLTSVSQLSAKIRQSVDKTAGKIRILFKDKDRNWDEIESKLRAEGDVPLLKTSNKEIASILQELKRVEKQLQVINVMVDPDGTLDALTSLGLTSPILPKPRTSPGTQGALPGNGVARAPLVSAPSEESERDFSLPLNRFTPSGEENAVTHE
ncbi:centrosomal protein of 170 kDa-like isoform X3 [Megalops cyprinoides]|uniref:centrosomal protein of 170 kDa-like isoform X3 n=1 Tax=Megalops cyprinoides TaxID=118141 RepID=UPI001864EE02|nr:centrosomal protein of 170 kDa-like isoform X3 [Megalops cyprinoides]